MAGAVGIWRARKSPRKGRKMPPRSFAPCRGFVNLRAFPRLTPWATFFRSYELGFGAFRIFTFLSGSRFAQPKIAVVPDAPGLRGAEQDEVQIPKRRERPPQESVRHNPPHRSEEHTSELQSPMYL